MKSNVNHNHYEAAKWKAIHSINRNVRMHNWCMKRFEQTGYTFYTFMAMYHMDAANRIARDWGMRITNYSDSHIEVRDLG